MKHLIIGAGPAGIIAAETLRRVAPDSEVTVVGDEPAPPYSRMALPYLIADQIDAAGTCLRHGLGHYPKLGVNLHRGRARAVSVDSRNVTLESGERLGWDRLLVATGSSPVRPDIPGANARQVVNCWTLDDASRVAARAQAGSRVVLMGAGFIGCIVLEALAARGVSLTVIEMSDRVLARMMDATGGEMIARWCRERGVRVMTGERVASIQARAGDDGPVCLALASGEQVEADLVVCATGVRPNLDCLSGTDIACDAGILVDNHLQTSCPDVFAAGDVAQGPAFATEVREVHAIQPTASEHGRIAALNMAGRRTRYAGSLAMNVLNTLGLVSSSFGQWMGTTGSERAVAADPQRFRYLRLELDGDRVAGALALGLTAHVGVLRGLIQTGYG